MKPKILIIGHARHGKDTLAGFWRDAFGLTFRDSSQRSAEIFIFDALREKYDYLDIRQCYADRVNHRSEWYDLICEYNKHDKARLAKDIMATSDAYVGMRSSEEIAACREQGVFDLVVWVDALERLPPEPASSFDITRNDADVFIENNGFENEFYHKSMALGSLIFGGAVNV